MANGMRKKLNIRAFFPFSLTDQTNAHRYDMARYTGWSNHMVRPMAAVKYIKLMAG